MTQGNPESLAESLGRVGGDVRARDAIVAALVEWEERNQEDGIDIRESITGPIVDALYRHEESVTRRLANGLVFTMPYRSKIAREFAMGVEPLTHIWEPQTSRLLVALARDARTVVIGGAYSGDHAILVAQELAEREGVVHCFELSSRQLAALEHNARQNGLNNIVVNAIGLWDRKGFIELVGDDSHASPTFVETEPARNGYPTTTIEIYAQSCGIESIDLLMLDIEGGEEFALGGALHFLDQAPGKAPDVVFEVHRTYVDWSGGLGQTAIVRMLTDRGYRVHALRDYQANIKMVDAPLEMVALDEAYLEGTPHGFNLFATKRPNRLEDLGVIVRERVSPKLLRHRLSHLHQPGRST